MRKSYFFVMVMFVYTDVFVVGLSCENYTILLKGRSDENYKFERGTQSQFNRLNLQNNRFNIQLLIYNMESWKPRVLRKTIHIRDSVVW